MRFDNLYYRVWESIRKWINKVVKSNDEDDNHFNHPYATF